MNPYLKLPPTQLLHGRFDFLINISRGKRVLHLGCVDTGLLEERFQRGELLHQKLQTVATDLWGVDLNQEGIEFLQRKGFAQLYTADVSALHEIEALRGQEFDLILAGEIVEHLLNPGLFFNSVAKLMKPGHTRLVVTVPCAFRVSSWLWLLRDVEFVHPDHNYWFSYLTLRNLLVKTGYTLETMHVYSFVLPSLIPRRLRQLSATIPRVGRSAAGDGEQSAAARPARVSLYTKVTRRLLALPRMLFERTLLSFSPFFGDGLIAIAIRDHD